MCLSMKSNLNIQYSHGDYNFQNISFTASQKYNQLDKEYKTSLLTVSFSDGIRWDNFVYLKIINLVNYNS